MQHTLTGTQFPDGTVVAAFPAERASGEGSSSVVAGGSVTFRNLYEGEQYVVRGYVAGRPLEERFESGYLDASPQVSIGDAVVAGSGVQLSTDGLGRLVISSTPAVRGAPVALGNMGAGSSLSMSNSAPVAVTGTLNANHVMTISDLRVGEPMFLGGYAGRCRGAFVCDSGEWRDDSLDGGFGGVGCDGAVVFGDERLELSGCAVVEHGREYADGAADGVVQGRRVCCGDPCCPSDVQGRGFHFDHSQCPVRCSGRGFCDRLARQCRRRQLTHGYFQCDGFGRDGYV
jgi:hypothetical protein